MKELPFCCHNFYEVSCCRPTQRLHQIEIKSLRRTKQGTVTSYCESVSCLLKTYTTDDVTAGVEAEMMRFSLPLRNSPTEFAEASWNKVPRCD